MDTMICFLGRFWVYLLPQDVQESKGDESMKPLVVVQGTPAIEEALTLGPYVG
jgi:hypothetical protein